MTKRVEQLIPPPEILRLATTLHKVDYADTFSVSTAGLPILSAREWAGLMLERTPARHVLRVGWKLLGLQTRPFARSGTVLSWPVLSESPDRLVLAAGSHCGMPAQLVFVREGRALLFGTLIEFRNPLMRAVWAPVSALHQRVVVDLLSAARTHAVAS